MKTIKIEAIEYLKPRETVIYSATINDRVVGSSVLYKVDYFGKFKSYEVSMTRVIPEYRGQGIAQKLFDYFLKDKSPDIVCGFTNNPLGVLYRQKSCKRNGMRNFFGNFDLDRKKFAEADLYSRFLNQYLKSKHVKLSSNPYFYLKNKSLSPDIPGMESYPLYLKNAFAGLLTAQKNAGTKKTAVYPLINIKKSILKTNG